MKKEDYKEVSQKITEEIMTALRGQLASKQDDYMPIVTLADEVENSAQVPQNATQMINGQGDVVTYSEDEDKISKK